MGSCFRIRYKLGREPPSWGLRRTWVLTHWGTETCHMFGVLADGPVMEASGKPLWVVQRCIDVVKRADSDTLVLSLVTFRFEKRISRCGAIGLLQRHGIIVDHIEERSYADVF